MFNKLLRYQLLNVVIKLTGFIEESQKIQRHTPARQSYFNVAVTNYFRVRDPTRLAIHSSFTLYIKYFSNWQH